MARDYTDGGGKGKRKVGASGIRPAVVPPPSRQSARAVNRTFAHPGGPACAGRGEWSALAGNNAYHSPAISIRSPTTFALAPSVVLMMKRPSVHGSDCVVPVRFADGAREESMDVLGSGRLLLIFVLSLASSVAAAKDMTFDIIYMNQTNVVVADGTIAADTPARFQSFLDTQPFDGFNFLIHLNSPGGNLYGGMELGRMIRKQGLAADIRWYKPRPVGQEWYNPGYDEQGPGECYSACALAFLGGKVREITDGAIIGFHQFSGGVGNPEETQIGTQIAAGQVLDYISEMGAAPSLFTRMSEALPNELFTPSREELLSYSIVSKDAFAGFDLEPYGDGIVASSIFPENAKGDNLVYQVTTYCKESRLYVLLSGRPDFPGLRADFNTSVGSNFDGFSIWREGGADDSYSYPPDAVVFRSGQQLAEIQVDTRFLEMIGRGRTRGAVQYPHSYGGLMYFDIEATPEDLKRISSSFKLCIG